MAEVAVIYLKNINLNVISEVMDLTTSMAVWLGIVFLPQLQVGAITLQKGDFFTLRKIEQLLCARRLCFKGFQKNIVLTWIMERNLLR